MSRRNFDIDENRSATVGWDSPLKSFFWQIWNTKDGRRISELEVMEVRDMNDAECDELNALYAKYNVYGGEAIIADSPLGLPGHKISTVTELQQSIKNHCVLPANVARQLVEDQYVNR